MATPQDLINEARYRIGDNYEESCAHVGHGCEPWCANFDCLIFDKAGVPCEHSSSAAGFAKQFTRIEDSEAGMGDVCFFNWDGVREVTWSEHSHVAVVESFNHDTDYFTVIEGNSGNGGPADTCVARTTYYNEDYFFTAFFRPDFTASEKPQGGTRYRVRTKEYGWHDWMDGLHDTGGSTDDFAGSEGCLIYGFEVEGYDYRIVRCDGSETINEQGNTDSPICGIEIMGDVTYQAHWTDINGNNGEWGKWEHGSDDNGAGKDEYHPLDMVRVK